MVTIAGNPAVSTPNAGRLDAALAGLDAMVSVDIYVNETTRHADVILPSPSALQKSHYDVALLQLALRNVANYSPPVLPMDDGALDDWEILSRLALVVQGIGATADPSTVDDLMIQGLVGSAIGDETSPIHGRDPEEILMLLGERRGPERMLDFMLRTGPYGDGFGAVDGEVRPGVPALNLDVLLDHPHGVDLGPLEPRLPDVLRTPSGLVELDAEPVLSDLDRLAAVLDRPVPEVVLVGRRDLRSNNSWMHNLPHLVRGKDRCTMHVNPDDAERLGLTAGGAAAVSSRAGSVVVPVEVTDAIMAGVVSIPHGWGHDVAGARLSVAAENAGVNSNLLADETLVDALSGNAVLNGIPVAVAPAD